MLHLFNDELNVYKRTLTPDSAGGDSISYDQLDDKWRVRITPVLNDYTVSEPSREYPRKIKLIGEIRNDLKEGDRIEFRSHLYEIKSLAMITGAGSIPDYIRAEAVSIGETEA